MNADAAVHPVAVPLSRPDQGPGHHARSPACAPPDAASPPDHGRSAWLERWGAAELQRQLQALEPGLRLEVVQTIGSTNSALLDAASKARKLEAAGGDPGTFATRLLVAEQQTQGRGRQGRIWHATPGASLSFSMALALAPEDWSGLSLAVGVALAEALDPATNPAGPATGPRDAQIGLKWPNDLWLLDATAPGGGRKLGGVLIETVPWGTGGRLRVCVIGVGLNIQPQPVANASSGVAWMQELQPASTAPLVLAQVAGPLLAGVRQFEREGFAGVAARFTRRDLLKGQPVTTTLPGLPEGTALGVDPTGALRVLALDGREHVVASGEVSVRPQPGRSA